MDETYLPRTSILLVDDDEDDYIIIRDIVSHITDAEFTVDWCSNYEDAKQRLKSNDYDLYLIDYRLGPHDGLELLEAAAPHERSEPFIILTGVGDKKIEQKAMRLGAADYLVKGKFDSELLSRTLRYAIQRKQIEEQRIEHLIELNSAKDEFISLASHQLRTPATGVKQYVGMILEGFAGTLTRQQEKLLRKAYESNERQLQIVADLLRVAQVDAGKVVLRKQRTNINDLVDDVINEQRSNFIHRQQSVYFERLDDDVVACIDRDTIRMVLENILDNASKYSDQQTSIAINVEDNSETVSIRITDQGVGIPPEARNRLFQKFSRIDNPLSTIVGGSGLGLYWAKKIVDLHDGSIEVASRVTEGSTFTVHLPKDDA